MIGKFVGALVGERIAGPNRRLSGALAGAAIPAIARRGLGPLAIAAAAAWGTKKLVERSRRKRQQR